MKRRRSTIRQLRKSEEKTDNSPARFNGTTTDGMNGNWKHWLNETIIKVRLFLHSVSVPFVLIMWSISSIYIISHHYIYSYQNPGGIPDGLFFFFIVPIGSIYWGLFASLGITISLRISKGYGHGCFYLFLGIIISLIILITPYVGSFHGLGLESGFWNFMISEVSNETYTIFLRGRTAPINSSIYNWIKLILRGAGYIASFIFMLGLGYGSTPQKGEDNIIYL